jgi:hypothetical protein
MAWNDFFTLHLKREAEPLTSTGVPRLNFNRTAHGGMAGTSK